MSNSLNPESHLDARSAAAPAEVIDIGRLQADLLDGGADSATASAQVIEIAQPHTEFTGPQSPPGPELTELRAALAQFGGQLAKARPELAELRAELAQLRANFTEPRAELTELREELGQLRDEFSQPRPELADLHAELAQLRDELTERARLASLRAKVTEPRLDLTELRVELREELAKAFSNLAEWLRAKLAKTRPELTELRAELAQLRTQLAGPRPELTELHTELAKLRAQLTRRRAANFQRSPVENQKPEGAREENLTAGTQRGVQEALPRQREAEHQCGHQRRESANGRETQKKNIAQIARHLGSRAREALFVAASRLARMADRLLHQLSRRARTARLRPVVGLDRNDVMEQLARRRRTSRLRAVLVPARRYLRSVDRALRRRAKAPERHG